VGATGVRRGTDTAWLSLGDAARLLGVDVSTLRAWADAGKLRVYRTPGGHRRFSVADLSAVLKSPEPSAERFDGLRIASAPREWMASRPWFARVDDASRVRARALCSQLMQTLSTYLEKGAPRSLHLSAGRRLGATLGHEVARWGLTPAQSTEIFLYFKKLVTDALAAPPRGDAAQVRSMREADVFLGEVLQAMMEARQEAHPG
jgi:excisionase family DNA binding protein